MSLIDIANGSVDLAGLVARARAGEEVLLSTGGHAVAKIVPMVDPGSAIKPRQLGCAAGLFSVPDDFDAPLPEDVLALFHNGEASSGLEAASLYPSVPQSDR